MRLKPPAAALAVVLVSGACAASAQTQAPGLWESRFVMKTQNGEMERAMAQMQQQLAALPPEQRKNVEAMMASRGVKMDAGGTTARFCLTKEQAARPPEPHLSGDCKVENTSRSGGTYKYRFECTKPQAMRGEGEMSLVDAKRYAGRSVVTAEVDGRPQTMTMEIGGTWLAADCGEVKPFVVPSAK